MSEKKLLVVYVGNDGLAAKKQAALLKAEGNSVILVDNSMFEEPEPGREAVIMADVPRWRADLIRQAYKMPPLPPEQPKSAERPSAARKTEGKAA